MKKIIISITILSSFSVFAFSSKKSNLPTKLKHSSSVIQNNDKSSLEFGIQGPVCNLMFEKGVVRNGEIRPRGNTIGTSYGSFNCWIRDDRAKDTCHCETIIEDESI